MQEESDFSDLLSRKKDQRDERLKHFFPKLDDVMVSLGVETEDLAEKAGLSASAIASYRRGARNPPLASFRKICRALDPDGSAVGRALISAWAPGQGVDEAIFSAVYGGASSNLEPKHAAASDDSSYREWLRDLVGYIDLRGITRGAGILRHDIFDLYTEPYVATGLHNWDLREGKIQGDQRTQLAKVVAEGRCVAIMGRPGSGKSTFLHFTATRCLSEEGGPLPLFLNLGDVYDFLLRRSENSEQEPLLLPHDFIDFVVNLGQSEGFSLSKDDLHSRSTRGECIWLFDGLDLVSSEPGREMLVGAIQRIAHGAWRRCKFVLTSRPLAMTGKSIPSRFEVVGIDDMHWSEVTEFVRRWTDIAFASSPKRKRDQQCEDLLRAIERRPDLRELAKNPLMLTCMAVIHYNDRSLPEGRAELLDSVLYWLFRSQDAGLDHRSQPRDPKVVEQLLRELALTMLERPAPYRPDRIGVTAAAEALAHNFDDDVEAAQQFLTNEESASGVLIREGAGDLSFWHQAFQDYLAAARISGKNDIEQDGWWPTIVPHLDKLEWREVISLVPACLNRLGSERVNLFFERLARSCNSVGFPAKARRFALAGSILGDLQVGGYRLPDTPEWNLLRGQILPLFTGAAGDLSLEDRYFAAAAFGVGGDLRLAEFESTWVAMPAGTFQMGAQATNRGRTNFFGDAAPWEGPVRKAKVDAFEARKFLITVQEYKHFVDWGGYSNAGYRFWSGAGRKWRAREQVQAPLDWQEQLVLPNCPVSGVSWYEAEAYACWLGFQHQDQGLVYRLPTETEWEYTARRDLVANSVFPWGDHLSAGDKAEANWGGSELRRKTPVGMFPQSNTADGICDMTGNVEEWCSSPWTGAASLTASQGRAKYRVVRGGSTIRFERLCRPTYRSRSAPEKRYPTIGFRLVRSAP